MLKEKEIMEIVTKRVEGMTVEQLKKSAIKLELDKEKKSIRNKRYYKNAKGNNAND